MSAIDTTTDAVVGSAPVGAGANYMVYDSRLNRLYVTNPVANTVTALSVAADPPAVVFTVPVAAGPSTVAVLPDGSRVYAVSSTKKAPCTSDPTDAQPCISSGVTAINATDGSIRKTIPLESTVSITSASLTGTDTTYTYSLTSGPALRPGLRMVIAGMADAGNNGTFTLAAANASTFTVANAAGATASGQSGVGAEVVEISSAPPTGCDVPGLGVPGGDPGGRTVPLLIGRVGRQLQDCHRKVRCRKHGGNSHFRRHTRTGYARSVRHSHSTRRRKPVAAKSRVRAGRTLGAGVGRRRRMSDLPPFLLCHSLFLHCHPERSRGTCFLPAPHPTYTENVSRYVAPPSRSFDCGSGLASESIPSAQDDRCEVRSDGRVPRSDGLDGAPGVRGPRYSPAAAAKSPGSWTL